ncbi:MAG: hypothetical protein ACK4E0_14060 [Chitinophagaceae bacterium]
MKFRNLVFLIVVAVILTAWFTKPSYDDFMKFREKQANVAGMAPSVDYSDLVLYSQVKVTYYTAREVNLKSAGGEKPAVAVPVKTEKYIGLFGRFWSMD